MNEKMMAGNKNLGLWGATMGFFFGMAAVSLFGPTAKTLGAVMHLDPTTIGFLVAIPSLSGSILRIPFGAWVDTTGGKRPFTILMLLAIVGIVGLTWIMNVHYPNNMDGMYPWILLFGLLAGCGVATFSVGISQASYWFPQREQGHATGLFGGVGTMAPGVFALLLPILIAKYGLDNSYIGWMVFLIVGTVLYILIAKNAPYFQFRKKGLSEDESKAEALKCGQELFPKGNVMQALSNSAKVPATWILTSLYFASFGGFLALTAWYHTYWGEFFGFSSIKAGVFTAIFSILSAIIRAMSGSLADKLGGRRLCIIAMVMLGAAAFFMGFSHNFALSLILSIIIAAAMGINNTAVFKMVPDYVPKAIGGASGWIGGLGAFGGFAIPPLMGFIADKFGQNGYALGFEIFVVLVAINLVILFVFMKPAVKPSAQ